MYALVAELATMGYWAPGNAHVKRVTVAKLANIVILDGWQMMLAPVIGVTVPFGVGEAAAPLLQT